ncbi:MAG: ABC transporter permease [Pirellulaceae bacterium]
MNPPTSTVRRPWYRSRTVRRFLRNRLAVVALMIVVTYLLTALLVFGGMITLDDTEARVSAGSIPALFQPQPPEKRLEDCQFWLDELKKALDQTDAKAALGDVQFGAVDVASLPLPELRETHEQARRLDQSLAGYADLNDAPEAATKLVELEELVAQLFPLPEGLGAVQRFIELSLGTDRQGRSIALRATYSIMVAVQIGLVTAVLSVVIGGLLGGAAGYFGSWVDGGVTWLYTTFSSIPYLVLLVLIAYMFIGTVFDGTLFPVYVAFCATFWIGPCRTIRGETLKIKQLEYVQAARSMGFSQLHTMVRHVLPNTTHLMLVGFSLNFIAAIKAEVILTFLGLGVKKGPSWGIMIAQSGSEVVNGFFSQIAAATIFMFGLVLAFNILSDALQDVFDPKHV